MRGTTLGEPNQVTRNAARGKMGCGFSKFATRGADSFLFFLKTEGFVKLSSHPERHSRKSLDFKVDL